jgi:hypothetical protein
VNQIVHLLAEDPRMPNHPIRHFLHDPKFHSKFRLVFNNHLASIAAMASKNTITILSGEDMTYYLRILSHEFIHIAISEKYVSNNNYFFLKPEYTAFQHIMEEAFANTIGFWTHISFPEAISDRQIRDWKKQQTSKTAFYDAFRNDFQVDNPDYNEEQLNARVAAKMLDMQMTYPSLYSLDKIPKVMWTQYSQDFFAPTSCGTFLIPEYEAYCVHGDALLHHQWNYLISMMPELIQQIIRQNNQTYDYYRSHFKEDIIVWAKHSPSPEMSILHWVNCDYKSNALARMRDLKTEDFHYDFLLEEDEQRLNLVIQEIDPSFISVDTSSNPQRLRQNATRTP